MKTIVVLGAGLAGAVIIPQVMKNFVLKQNDYKLVVVAPNTHVHWTIAMPRIIAPGLLPEDKGMVSLEPQFKGYPSSKFEFVLGAAGNLDPAAKVVTVTLNHGGSRAVSYDTLIIATGTSTADGAPWKIVGTTEKTKEVLQKYHEDITRAKSVLISGGGITGTETAGEFGTAYSATGKKDVTFVYSDALPLPGMMDSVRNQAKTELERFKVKLVPNTKVTKATPTADGQTVVELTSKDGKTTTVTVGAYVPATGLRPNADFAPASMRDANGYIKTTKNLLAEGYDNIFVVGDASNLEDKKAMIADAQVKHLLKGLPDYLLRGTPLPPHKLDTRNAAVVTLGPKKSTGQMSGFKLPGFLGNFAKGKTLLTERVPSLAAGNV
jgi:apoptosis-inducing factor 2